MSLLAVASVTQQRIHHFIPSLREETVNMNEIPHSDSQFKSCCLDFPRVCFISQTLQWSFSPSEEFSPTELRHSLLIMRIPTFCICVAVWVLQMNTHTHTSVNYTVFSSERNLSSELTGEKKLRTVCKSSSFSQRKVTIRESNWDKAESITSFYERRETLN